jgi:hypothetical protein
MTDTDALLNALVETVTRLSSELGELRGEVQSLRAWRDGIEAQRYVTASASPAHGSRPGLSAPQTSEQRVDEQDDGRSPRSADLGEEDLILSLRQAMDEEVTHWQSRLAVAQTNFQTELRQFHQRRKRQREEASTAPGHDQEPPVQHADPDDPTEWDYFAKPREEQKKGPPPKAIEMGAPQPLPRAAPPAASTGEPVESVVGAPVPGLPLRPMPKSLTFDKPRPPSPPLPRRRDRVPLAKILQERQKGATVADPSVAEPSAATATSDWPQPIQLAEGLVPHAVVPDPPNAPPQVIELSPYKSNPVKEEAPPPEPHAPQLTVLSQSTPRSTVSPTQDH